MKQMRGTAWVTSAEKRLADITVASVLLPILSPLAIASAGVVLSIEKAPPFLTQQRIGRGGVPFAMTKIRTMPPGTPEVTSNGHYDERRTAIGRVLSALRIDEIPQLRNVVSGGMSLVGPRPLVNVTHDTFMDALTPSIRHRVTEACAMARPGWFDPYAVDVYIDGIEDSPEARAESVCRYVFEDASASHDIRVISRATGIIRALIR